MIEFMDEREDAGQNEWMNKWMDELDEWKNSKLNEWIAWQNALMNEWMNNYLIEFMNEWKECMTE